LARMLGRFVESGRHYQTANRLHRQRKDSFGTAYSYCGLGNVERMNDRLDGALEYFLKAEKLYKRIGDKVSYAYTLWSIGTTYKLNGDLKTARRLFDEADKLFRSTGDLRGRSYAALGRAELLWMQGSDGERERAAAERFAKAGGYAWELLHAKMMKGGKAAKGAKKAYAAMGSKFCPGALPINWP
jgi:tetratricopeptide (TPR) repeat protein